MAVKTIEVDITGLDKIAKAEKSISSLRNAVLSIEKDLKSLSGRRNSPLSFSIELRFNEDKVKQDYLKIKNMIENIPINVKSKEGRVELKQSNRMPRDSGYVRVRDQDYQSWRNLHKAIGDVSTASLNLMSTMTKLGAVNPAKGMLSVFNQINSKAMELHGNLMNLVGGKLQGGLQNAISGVLSGVRSGISQITQETENIGNAMQVFRVNMGALGFDEKEINKSIKRLGDYGKATVFDASDLLEQASTYYAYDRKDAEDIVKGISGLVAQTKDPVQGLKSVGIQVSQMLAAGKLNQQDFRFMRERFSALGASEVNARLLELSKSKGYNTIIDATRHGDISANEVLDILKDLGNSDKFQNLVTSILTPRQALENLKETLGNLFVFDQIDDEGNATPGALNKVYVATRDFIKGITEIVGTDTFEKYIKRLGDSIGGTIQKINQFGKVLKLLFGNEVLSTINNFSSGFTRGIKGLEIGKILTNSIRDALNFFNTNGERIGSFVKQLVTNIAELGDTALSVATEAISGGLLDAIAGIVKIYDNIGKLAVNTGAVKTYANAIKDITDAFNKVLEHAQNLKSLQNLALSIKDFISTVTSVASNFVIKTGVIDNLAQVIDAVVRTLSTVLANVEKTVNYPRAQSALKQITKAIKDLLDNVEPILEEIIRSAINVATSQAGVNFFKAVANFVQAVTNAIKQTLVSIGGSVEGGLTKLLNIVTGVVDFAGKVASLLGVMGKYVIMGFVATKFVTWATGIISSLSTVATAMSSVSNGGVNPFGMGESFRRTGSTIREGVDVNYTGMTRTGRNSSKAPLSRVARNKRARLAKFGNLALVGSDIALGVINGAVQDSEASQNVKDFTSSLSNVAGWAATGASLGSFGGPIGTAIGGTIGTVVGIGSEIWGALSREKEEKRLKKEALEEADKVKKEEYLQQFDHLKELAQESSNIQKTYFKSLTKDTSLVDSVVGANYTIEAIKNNSGTTVEGALRQLGIEVAKVPENVDSLFVKIGDEVKNWKELKEETGYTDEQLLQSLQLAQSTIGNKFVELVNETGQEVVTNIQTTTDAENRRQSSNIDTFKGKLGELGLKLQEGKEFIFKDITSVVEQLETIKKDSNLTGDAKSKAIDEVLSKFGFANDEFINKTLVEKLDIVEKIIKEREILGGSADEQFADVKKEIATKVTDYKDTLGKVIERIGNTELQSYLSILKDADDLKGGKISELDELKIEGFKDKIKKFLEKGYLKVDEANLLLEKAGITGIKVEDLGNKTFKFKSSVTNLLSDGKSILDSGTSLIKGFPPSPFNFVTFSKTMKELNDEVNWFIRNALGKLEKAKEEAKKANDYDEVRDLVNEQNLYENRLNSRIRFAGGIIPEYHSKGLSVGINWQRRGTDTVPTMLTPGEYVLRKKAVDSLGTNFLNNLNKYGVNALQTMNKSTIINNVYNTNNAKISQNIDNKSQYLNGMFGVDKLMRYV